MKKFTYNSKSIMADGVKFTLLFLLNRLDLTDSEINKMREAKDRFDINIFEERA